MVIHDRRRQAAAIVGVGLLLALATWPIAIRPIGGIDGSWEAGISMAIRDGLRWGHEVVFTYGPLGFLTVPRLFDSRLGAAAWVFVGFAHVALYVVVVWLSLRDASWKMALLLVAGGAVLATRMTPTAALALIALIVCIELLRRDHGTSREIPRRVVLAVMGALGLLAALVLLTKLNDGVAIVTVSLVTAGALTVRRRALPMFLTGTGIGLVAFWLGAGQQLPDLLAYVSTGRDMATGYSTAMGLEDPTRDWEYVGVVVAIGVIVWRLWWTVRGRAPAARAAVVVAVALIVFETYKQAFVRHGGGGFFELAGLVAVWVLPWGRNEGVRRILVFAAFGLAVVGTTRISPLSYVDLQRIPTAIGQALTIAAGEQREAIIHDARVALRADYAIPDTMLRVIGHGTLHVEPFETAVLWAYPELSWQPLPIMQPYAAYTTTLDGLNADALASESGPDVILRALPSSIDGRHPFFESPEAILVEVCRYTEIESTDRWQLLARGPMRCGPREPLGIVTVMAGDLVTVPAESRSDRIVVAHVDGIELGPAAALRAFVDKSPTWSIEIGNAGTYRLVPGTASGPLILATPKSLGWSGSYRPPSDVDFFRVGTGSGRLAEAQPMVPLTIRFESMALGALPPAVEISR